MQQEKVTVPDTNQELALGFATRFLQAKRDKKAARIFARTTMPEKTSRRKTKKEALTYLREDRKAISLYKSPLSEDHQETLQHIKDELSVHDKAYLEAKKGNFSPIERTKLLIQAKSKYLSGLTNEERIRMYKDAGYTDKEISNITGKKLLLTAAMGGGTTVISEGLRSGSAIFTKAIPFIDKIPTADLKMIAGVSLLTYAASVLNSVQTDLKLTKRFGTSTNTMLTSLYASANRVIPNKARDWLARGAPVGYEFFLQSSVISAAAATTGDLRKIAAVGFVSAAYNFLGASGGRIALHIAERGRKKREKEFTPALQS